MSNSRTCRRLNRGSGQFQRPKGSWGMRRHMFAGSGATHAQQHSFLSTMRAVNSKVAEATREVTVKVANVVNLGHITAGRNRIP